MTLLQLRYFREVAHTKHFTAAAENLHVAQPSLSYSIKELEKELAYPSSRVAQIRRSTSQCMA